MGVCPALQKEKGQQVSKDELSICNPPSRAGEQLFQMVRSNIPGFYYFSWGVVIASLGVSLYLVWGAMQPFRGGMSVEARLELDRIKKAVSALERLLTDEAFNPDLIIEWVQNKPLAPLLKAIAKAESNFDPKAVSHAGAEGLMQLMPAIQKHFGVADPFDPKQSVEAAEKLLEEELQRFGDVHLALAAYNAGSPRVNNALLKAGSHGWLDVKHFLPKETQNYVPKVVGLYEMYRQDTNTSLIV